MLPLGQEICRRMRNFERICFRLIENGQIIKQTIQFIEMRLCANGAKKCAVILNESFRIMILSDVRVGIVPNAIDFL